MMSPGVSEIRLIADRKPATASPARASLKDNSSTEFCRCRPEIKSTGAKVMIHRRTTTCGHRARIFIVSDYGWRNRPPFCPLAYRLSPHRWRADGIVQLAVRAPARRQGAAADRGYRPRALNCRRDQRHHRRTDLAPGELRGCDS